MSNVLCVMAHPDDETFACGASLAMHAAQGDTVVIMSMGNGVGARADRALDDVAARTAAFYAATKLLGATAAFVHTAYLDQQADVVSQLSLNRRVEAWVTDLQPALVYTHFPGDLNLDHRRVADAVLVATRGRCPVHQCAPEWPSRALWPFTATRQQAVEPTRSQKLDACRCYAMELRAAPHPRSLVNFESQEYENFICVD